MRVEPAIRSRIDAPADVTDRTGHPEWGSDVVADMLRGLDIEYAAVVPGSSYRGVHDSIVNYAGNRRPQLILCTHEAITVALARGYARATGRPMAAILHNVVGLLNGAMTIFDAWCDRVPVLVLGGTGPMDATRRRPWIEWIHTATSQGDLIRSYLKWDDQPASVAAIPEALLRGYRIAVTEPQGPVYVCFDLTLQEERITEPFALPDVARYRPAAAPEPDRDALRRAADLLVRAELPIAVADAVGREPAAARTLVELAELLAMPVLDPGQWWRNFPTPHALDFTAMQAELLPEADAVIGLDMVDLDRALRPAKGRRQTVINISLDELAHRGGIADFKALPAADVPILASARRALPLLLEECRRRLDATARSRVERRRVALVSRQEALRDRQRAAVGAQWDVPGISETRLAGEVWRAVKDEDWVLAAGGRRATAGVWEIPAPERDLSGSGAGAVGAATSTALGTALALKGTGKLPVAIVGDGDFLMSAQALWTAAHYRIPILWVISNNRSYFNDEVHQDNVARARGRPVANRWIGQRMEEPSVDFAALARTFGIEGEGPVEDPDALAAALRRAVTVVREGGAAVVDARVANRAGL